MNPDPIFFQIFTFFRAFLFAYGGVKAAKVIHGKLLKSILGAPISFFDVTPVSIEKSPYKLSLKISY